MSSYLGPRVSMEGSANLSWIHWSHFRREFYNYSYVFALLVVKALHVRLAANPDYIGEFRRLLRTGKSQKTRDLLSSMDLDVSTDEVWRLGLGQFASTLGEAKRLAYELGKI